MSINQSEIRKAYLLDKYVIITPGRALRPGILMNRLLLNERMSARSVRVMFRKKTSSIRLREMTATRSSRSKISFQP